MRGTVWRPRRAGRPRRRSLAAEQLLEAQQRPGEGICLPLRKAGEEGREAVSDRVPRRVQGLPARRRERELLAAAVRGRTEPSDQTGLLERRDELGDRRGRDGGATGELGADHLSLGDRLQRQKLARRERRMQRCEHALDPAGCDRSDAAERVGRLLGYPCVDVMEE